MSNIEKRLLSERNARARKEYKRARTKATKELKRIYADEYEELVDNFLRREKMEVLPSSSYDDYIHSKEWAMKRAEVFSSRKSRCAMCLEKDMKKLHVHHKTYCRLGNERMEDLVILCQNCHLKVHDYYENTKGLNLRKATDTLIEEAKKKRSRPKKKAVPSSVKVRQLSPKEVEKYLKSKKA